MKRIDSTALTPPPEILNRLKHCRGALVSAHLRPDGDALGSIIGFVHLMELAGIPARGVVQTKEGLGGPAFLRGVDNLLVPQETKTFPYDTFVSLDCATFERIPSGIKPLATNAPCLINIDHHCTNTRFGHINWVLGNASSTAEVVWRFARKHKLKMDEIAAEAFWVALVTDTGRFAYDSVGPATLRCAADLLKNGVRTDRINDLLFNSFPMKAMELKKRAFQSLTVEGDLAWVQLTRKDFADVDGSKSDAEDVVDIPRSVDGNMVAIFFYGSDDNTPGETHISIRGRAPLDVSSLAQMFEGGGHKGAAGCTIKECLSKSKKMFFTAYRTWRASQGA